MADIFNLAPGSKLKLLSLPELYFGPPTWLKVGQVYDFKYYDGSCVCISNPTDPNEICTLALDRLKAI